MPPNEGKDIVLRFDTWWEIESFDAPFFDLMEISIYDVAANTMTSLGVLNPAADANGLPAEPFTSSGYNTPPVWAPNSVDVSAFAGKTIQLVFGFNTGDGLYNGFRGWLIDNVRIVQEEPVLAAAFMQSVADGSNGGLNPVPTVSTREEQ